LPFQAWETWFCFYHKASQVENGRLQAELRKMPSLYPLCPPETDRYMKRIDTDVHTNPLSATEGVVSADHKLHARNVHEEIRAAFKTVRLGADRLHVFAGVGTPTITDFSVQPTKTPGGEAVYRLEGVPACEDGDGTVSIASATFGSALNLIANVYEYRVKHDEICEDANVLEKVRQLII